MPEYKYKARDNYSRSVSGSIVADSQDAASRMLQSQGYVPISIIEIKGLNAEKMLKRFQTISPREVSSFTRQLYSLQKAGLPLLSSLEAISLQTHNRYFREVIGEISRDIRAGANFSTAIRKHPRVFDSVYISMMRAAESGGNIVEVLQRLTQLIDQEIDTRQRISAATRYPLLAFGALCLGFLILVTFVIPRYAAVYSQYHAALPIPTRILIFIGVFINNYWYLFLLLVIAVVAGFQWFINSRSGRPAWDLFKLKFPVIGELVSLLIMARFARVTALLMKSGVPILEVLDLVGGTAGNVVISRALLGIKESVNQGKGMSEPMKLSGLFPPTVIQMVAVGEQTGKVDDLLMSVADYYDTEADFMIKNLTTYIEPALIFALACMVLLMALAVFMPMWNLIRIFKH